jgi:poly(3-hydroxybutyrate) depolymerase
MRRAGLLCVAVALSLGLAAGTTHAAKAKKVASQVDIDGINQPPPDFHVTFVGNVYSKKAKCVRNREVTIYYTEGGGHELVGTATTDATGDWQLDPDSTPSGNYEAEVARKRVKKAGKKLVCKAAVSPSWYWAS